MEQKYEIGTQSGHLLWDIGAMLKEINQYHPKTYAVSELSRINPFRGNTEYAMTTDISIPLIIVELCEGKEKLIDGNHRLYQAAALGLKSVSAYCLKREEHQRFIENYDRDLYDKIVAEF